MVAVVVLAGCSASVGEGAALPTSGITAEQIDDSPSGWVHVEPSAVIYLAFAADSTGDLTGNLSIASTSASGTDVDSGAYTMTGTLDGSTIAVTFNDKTWTGKLTDDALVLNVPQRDGTIAQARWKRGSIDDYNAAVADLQSGAQTASDISIQAATDAATASSLRAAADAESARVARVYNAADSDVSSLNDIIAELPDVLAEVDAAVAAAQTAANDPALTGPCDFGAASYALDSVGYAVDSVTYAIDSVGYTTSNAPSTISDLQGLLADLSVSAQTDLQVDIQDAGNAAIAAVYSAISAANSADTKSQAKADAIYATAATAEHAHCPNDASTDSPSPTTASGTGSATGDDSYPLALARHSTGPNVAHVQDRLNAWGWSVDADGEFGPATDRAVRQFQAGHGLTADGYVGQDTLDALDSPVDCCDD
jgi:murein L,D-transpeptidase YcbB/YkuD